MKSSILLFLYHSNTIPQQTWQMFHPSIRGACIVKDLADALLLRRSTLALGLVEEGIWVWAPQLASLRVQILMWTLEEQGIRAKSFSIFFKLLKGGSGTPCVWTSCKWHMIYCSTVSVSVFLTPCFASLHFLIVLQVTNNILNILNIQIFSLLPKTVEAIG